MALHDDMVGRPYERGSNGPYTYDCAGVVIAYVGRLFGRKLKALRGVSTDDDVTLMRRQSCKGGILFAPVKRAERVGDVLLTPGDTTRHGQIMHVSVLVDATMRRYLTAFRSSGVVMVAEKALGKPISAWRPQP